MLVSGSRNCQHLFGYDQYRHHRPTLGLGLGFCSAKIVHLSSFILRPLPSIVRCDRLQQRMVSSSSRHCKSPGEIPILHDCYSQQEDNHGLPVEGLSPVAGGIVALGKFDALHIGHRELAIQASRVGIPYLLSFVGMAEVLGWEPRPPIVAKCDRKRVLSSWASYCGNVAPTEFQIEFSSVRHLSPQQFVEKLSKELRVCGVVAGKNYRFGYRASGDASELVRLCEEYGLAAYIINSVMDKNQDLGDIELNDVKERGQVSSTRVRHALGMGDMDYVTELLGRPHRLVLKVRDRDLIWGNNSKWRVLVPKSCLLNLPPREGFYDNCFLLVDADNPIPCRVLIDETHLYIDTDEIDLCSLDSANEFQLMGIEFGKSS